MKTIIAAMVFLAALMAQGTSTKDNPVLIIERNWFTIGFVCGQVFELQKQKAPFSERTLRFQDGCQRYKKQFGVELESR